MQAENGCFYNFVDSDYQINKEFRTSQAKPGWWTWRAMWAISEAICVYKDMDVEYVGLLKKSFQKTLKVVYKLQKNYSETIIENDIKLPTWLPYNYASDQAAIIIKALVPYCQTQKEKKNDTIAQIIRKQADGICLMQKGNKDEFPFGTFLSWGNLWHAYGNSQADALLQAGNFLNEKGYLNSALLEINNFYTFLEKEKYLNSFSIEKQGAKWTISEKKQFEQIAYGIRPMVMACLQAYKITGEKTFARQAGGIACWLFGKNITGKSVYSPETGRCFDGINDKENINYNSGAESTIEALLILLEVEQIPPAKKILHDYYKGL